MVQYLRDSPLGPIIARMLEALGRGTLPRLVIAPVIIRGQVEAHRDDLEPLRSSSTAFAPAVGRGVTVSIGTDLTEFGRVVMSRARAA
jgi:hypothetical protein